MKHKFLFEIKDTILNNVKWQFFSNNKVSLNESNLMDFQIKDGELFLPKCGGNQILTSSIVIEYKRKMKIYKTKLGKLFIGE